MAYTTTGTGFDRLVNIITTDKGLKKSVSATDIQTAATAAATMNTYLVEAIKYTGVAWDKSISAADLKDVNRYLEDNYQTQWADLHGNDEDDSETGFHLVQDDGATTRLFGANALDDVGDKIYHLGFEVKWGYLMNEDGDWNASLKSVANYMNQLLAADYTAGRLKTFDAYAHATTGTGLDKIVNTIVKDPGLNNEIATSQITEGANAANSLNAMIIDAIKQTNVANDGNLTKADIRELNYWIQDNKSWEWTDAHGDDDGDYESGYHLVVNDGATTKLFSQNAVDTVGDGIYHLGFDIKDGYFMNEDGNWNASVTAVTSWLNQLLKPDIAKGTLKGTGDAYAHADTHTGLDQLVNIIIKDTGLNNNLATHEITQGAEYADSMNAIIIEALKKTGVATDKNITATDVVTLNGYIQANHSEWADLHGQDEDDYEAGFHLVKGDGASTKLYGVNAVNVVAESVYQLGFDLDGTKFTNEDGDTTNTTTTTVATYLTSLLQADLAAGALKADYIT